MSVAFACTRLCLREYSSRRQETRVKYAIPAVSVPSNQPSEIEFVVFEFLPMDGQGNGEEVYETADVDESVEDRSNLQVSPIVGSWSFTMYV